MNFYIRCTFKWTFRVIGLRIDLNKTANRFNSKKELNLLILSSRIESILTRAFNTGIYFQNRFFGIQKFQKRDPGFKTGFEIFDE
jgi:hypothetical protein